MIHVAPLLGIPTIGTNGAVLKARPIGAAMIRNDAVMTLGSGAGIVVLVAR